MNNNIRTTFQSVNLTYYNILREKRNKKREFEINKKKSILIFVFSIVFCVLKIIMNDESNVESVLHIFTYAMFFLLFNFIQRNGLFKCVISSLWRQKRSTNG